MPDLSPKREYVEAPAGHGKTEAIANEVEKNTSVRKVLVLTHTNAGVISLKKRFKKKSILSKCYDIFTIDAFSLRFSQFYPSVSDIPKNLTDINGDTYKKARTGAIKIFDYLEFRNYLKSIYELLLVDEYQDCSMSQHNLILKLSESIDCLVFGDPMQSIFDFDSEGFNWNIDLCNNFVRNSNISLDTPYRWINSGTPNLGIWVQGVREKLKNGKKKEINSLVKPTEIKIEKSESNISADDYERIVATEICKIINDLPPKESVLVLVNGGHSRPNLRHTIARNMFCKIQSIEKIESPVLISFLSNLDTFTNSYRRSPISLYNLIRDFAKKCMTGTSQISQSLNLKLSQYPTKSIPELRQLDNRLQAENGKLYNLILDIYEYKKREITLNLILKLVKDFTTSANNIYRKEIWRSAVEAITMALRSENKSLKECGISIRQKTSFLGRNFNRVIGTTLLTKGLEFDHVIILNLSNLDDKNLYVALSRASKSITILK